MKHKAEIAGALAGAGMFFAVRGAAKVVGGVFKAIVPGIESPEETPWKYRPHPSQLQYEHYEHEEVFVQQTIQRQPQSRKNHNVVIDMGNVVEYDPNDIHNLVKEQQFFRNQERLQQQAIREQQAKQRAWQQNDDALRRKCEAEGKMHPRDAMIAAEQKAMRKAKARREKGIIASWFTK